MKQKEDIVRYCRFVVNLPCFVHIICFVVVQVAALDFYKLYLQAPYLPCFIQVSCPSRVLLFGQATNEPGGAICTERPRPHKIFVKDLLCWS